MRGPNERNEQLVAARRWRKIQESFMATLSATSSSADYPDLVELLDRHTIHIAELRGRETYSAADLKACSGATLSWLRPRQAVPLLGGFAISAEAALSLVQLVLDKQPAVVLELGSGVSTLLVAYALEQVGSGQLMSLDDDGIFAQVARRHLTAHGFGDSPRATVRHAPLVEHRIGNEPWRWYDSAALSDLGGIHMVIVDGPPGSVQPLARYPALPMLRSKLASGSVIFVDDTVRADGVKCLERWQREVPSLEVEHFVTPEGNAVLTVQ